ncbi:MAG TPA: hypothetical protein VGA61_16595 [Anaerolineae bacterium]
MMMDRGGRGPDDEVVRLLGKLRDTGPAYPPRLYTARRAAVLAGLAALQIGGVVAGASLLAKLVKLLKGMSVVEKIVLGVEVAAVTGMTAYGATAAYIYRDQLKQLLLPGPSITTPYPSLSVPSTPPPGQGTGVSGTPTPSPTGSLTVTPFFTAPISPGGDSTPLAPTVAQPTQAPPTQPPPTKPGNSYGLTKTPKPQSTTGP